MALRIYITKNFDHMSYVAATLAEKQIQRLQASKQECVLGLATGSSPTGMYKHLAKAFNNGSINPARVRSFNLDEYVGLPGSNAQQRALHCKSYSYFMVTEFFGLMPVKFAETFVPYGLLIEQKALEGALENMPQHYELRGSSHGKAVTIASGASELLGDIRRDILEEYQREMERVGGVDLQIIGIGGHGHVAFHESGIPFDGPSMLLVKLDENTIENAVADGHFANRDASPHYAITMSAELVFQAKHVMLLANGPRKTKPMGEALLGAITPEVPVSYAQRYVQDGGAMTCVMDESAAADILQHPDIVKEKGYEIIDCRAEAYTELADLNFIYDAGLGSLR